MALFTRFGRWFSTPSPSSHIDSRNFVNVQIDAIGVALASAAAPFLPVYLTHLNASTFQISMLTAMPAVTGILLAIPLGRVLQRQRQVVPWFSAARLLVILCYALTGIITFILPQSMLPNAILVIWALATIPQTVVAIGFTVVMNGVAGSNGRYELMARRWSILGLTTSLTVVAIGELLNLIIFPLNYQVMFLALSVGGFISYYFSSHIKLADHIVEPEQKQPLRTQIQSYVSLIGKEKGFLSFVGKRFVFLSGASMIAPLLPIYFVHVIQASDSWIAAINTAQTAVLIFGYFFWTRQSRQRGSRPVLLWTCFGLGMYPILAALTNQPWLIAIYAGVSGIFQAGSDLVFFDELLKTFPAEYTAVFVSVSQSFQFLSTIIAPVVGSFLAGVIGIGPALIVGGLLRLAGFGLFALKSAPNPQSEQSLRS